MEGGKAGSQHSVTLNNGVIIPLTGLGTFRLRGQETLYKAVDAALACGYRSFDTATVYQNEKDLGQALQQLLPRYGLNRGDVFITSKLAPSDLGEGTREACLRSIAELGCEYLDLYLIHWPGKQGRRSEDSRNAEAREISWKTMEDLYKSGLIKAIGVSNYTEKHLTQLLSFCHIVPAVLQVEFHPRLPQKSLLEFCRTNGIHFQAYSSLGCGELLSHEDVREVANKHGRTPSQILLQWALRQGVGVIPKSSDPKRIKENFAVWDFELSELQANKIKGDGKEKRYCWDPSEVA
ncbi:hypothetical protein GDO86_008599 [Hymenochirus boettgeri]|uniref:NADP-dependent oxidoreductase domain-containing protein n=1 Tax=Hymenochirus boettgeri TaxID=247094 RepID=A0A8T2J129_9PIPI|nr:hypothetical protein GDO86_008599 [Hymenochirus boettgeri]